MYIDNEYEKRLNLQQLSDFLLYGTEKNQVTNESYDERIEKTRKEVSKIIEKYHSQLEEHEEIMKYIYEYASAVESVYMEIGMKCGAKLLVQLLENQLSDI